MRKDKFVPEVAAYEGNLIVINYFNSSKILVPKEDLPLPYWDQIAKASRVFTPGLQLGALE